MSAQLGFTVKRSGMRFTARLEEMAANEIAAMIPPATLKDIKETDPTPLFKAFVVGHEGESTGNIVGIGNIVKRWFKTMVRALGEKVRAGLQLFHGHGATNDHAGRIPIGQVVGKDIKDIDGRESVVVACHIFKPFAHLPLDVASVETSVDYAQSEDGSLEITDIHDVTGIALGNSSIERPGFPGATLLGQLQAFEASNKTPSGSKLRLGYSNDKGQAGKLRLA